VPAAAATMAAADLTCTDCHNDTSMLTGKDLQWEASGHGEGTAYLRGTSASCAGCHAGQGFSERIAAGITDPDTVAEGVADPTRQDCRTCHQIHTTYTGADFALETTDPVVLYAMDGTFDMGAGNLCANCHQPRRAIEVAADGTVDVDSTHWGPHHGPQSTVLMGIGGSTDGNAGAHYSVVSDGCVTCHMGDTQDHTMAPAVATCQECHADAENLDVDGVQTEIHALYDELTAALQAKGLVDDAGSPVVGIYPAAQAGAIWDYAMIADDGSWGVHNPGYIKTLLTADIAALQ